MARGPAAEVVSLERLLADDRRYKLEAYQFVAAGLDYAQQVMGLGKPGTGKPGRTKKRRAKDDAGPPVRHISGQELCLALKELAHRQYGMMAKLVLAGWGVHATSDFGEIVYNLIRIGKMSKSDGDQREDFDNVYDFQQALVRDYAITKEQEESCPP